MYYVEMKDGQAVGATREAPVSYDRDRFENRNDWKSFERAGEIAAQLTKALGSPWLPVDNGPHHYPRYDVCQAPRMGDAVSFGFNGDVYPCGHVTGLSKSLRVVRTSSGRTFYRRRETASWVNAGTWSLVVGHVRKLNPEF